MNKDLIRHASNYLEKLANGVNPLNGEKIPDNDIVNNVRISRCLFYVNTVLNQLLEDEISMKKTRDFYLSASDLAKYSYDDGDLTVTKIATKLNDLINDVMMKPITSIVLSDWLVQIGVLKLEQEGRKKKVPTQMGKDIGVYCHMVLSNHGPYEAVFYSRKAQQFIIDNFDNFLEFLESRKNNVKNN